jgi:hypothetical protein
MILRFAESMVLVATDTTPVDYFTESRSIEGQNAVGFETILMSISGAGAQASIQVQGSNDGQNWNQLTAVSPMSAVGAAFSTKDEVAFSLVRFRVNFLVTSGSGRAVVALRAHLADL